MFFSLGHESLNRNIVKNVDVMFSQPQCKIRRAQVWFPDLWVLDYFYLLLFHSSNDMNIRYLAKLQTYQ